MNGINGVKLTGGLLYSVVWDKEVSMCITSFNLADHEDKP